VEGSGEVGLFVSVEKHGEIGERERHGALATGLARRPEHRHIGVVSN